MSSGPSSADQGLPLVLASGSPRRRELLSKIGLEFEVVAADIDESLPVTCPEALVRELSLSKSQAVARDLHRRSIVLGADTIVVLDGNILGKPRDAAEAFAMLRSLSGREHEVFTAVSIVDSSTSESETVCCVSRVLMRHLSDAEIKHYIATGEPFDKAGAYALQGIASAFVKTVHGCYTNVIGLPLSETVTLLRRHGIKVLGEPVAE